MAAIVPVYVTKEPQAPAMVRPMNLTEQQLLDGCKRQDRQIQSLFYQKYHGKMLAVCMRYTKDRGTALDILNRGFLRIFQKIDQYLPTGSLEGWIKVIIIHAVADYFKQQKKQPVLYAGAVPEDKQVLLHAERISKEDLVKALHQLPQIQKTVFNLFAIEGYAHKEIATLLDMNENTVRWVYAEAKKKLQQILTHYL